jgi:hypothetical protein
MWHLQFMICGYPKILLLSALLCLCKIDVLAESGSPGDKTKPGRIVKFQMENDRLGGSDDGHTHSLRFCLVWPNHRPDISFSINYESLTRRHENSRVDLLGIDAAFGYSAWTDAHFTFSGGFAVNGDLGGESLQNALHEWLNESTLHLAYPDAYAFGITAGTSLDQRLTTIGEFRLTATGDLRVASNAAPSWVRGGIYLSRRVNIRAQTRLDLQIGMSVYGHFWLDDILKPYYGRGYSLDSSLGIEWKRLAMNVFFDSNPYGIDQGILGVSIGCYF